jgi:nitrite reductase (NADH) small subunit
MAWVKACMSDDLTPGTIARQRIGGGPALGLTRLPDDRVVAFENRCPHRAGPLSFGKISGTEVICPWHFFRFDLISGKAAATDQSIMELTTYPVKVEDGIVFVELPEQNSTAMRPDAVRQGTHELSDLR